MVIKKVSEIWGKKDSRGGIRQNIWRKSGNYEKNGGGAKIQKLAVMLEKRRCLRRENIYGSVGNVTTMVVVVATYTTEETNAPALASTAARKSEDEMHI